MGILDSLFGSTTSTTKFSSLNTTCTSLISSALQQCSSLIAMTQTVAVNGNGNTQSGNVLTQQVQFTQNCPQLVENIANLQSSMAAAIQQATTATGQIVQLSSTSSDTETEIRNQVNNAVNVSSMNQLMSTLNQAQIIVANGNSNVQNSNTLSQTATVIASASQTMLNKITALNDFDTNASQSSSATTQNPFQFLADILGGNTMLYILIIIAVLCVGYLVYPRAVPQSARIEGGSPYLYE